MTGGLFGRNSEGILGQATQGTPSFEVRSSGSNAAYMNFHRAGHYAVRFGLDTDNQLKVGGWSMGNVAHTMLHTGNSTYVHSNSSTATASWIRFSNGMQICYGEMRWTTALATTWGSMFTSGTSYQTLTYPVSFTNLNSWSLVANSGTGPMPAYGYPMSVTASSMTFFLGTAVSTSSREWVVRYILVGRWN